MIPIRVEGLTKRFDTPRGSITAVDDVTLTVRAGELFFLLGPSGCGKTTLLRMLAGFVDPTAGRVFFGEEDVTRTPPERRDAAMVFQTYALWPHMTVAKNVAFGLSMRGVGRSRRRQVVREMLETVRIAEKAGARPMELSGGQQQRVALARALAPSPKCLLLDEPLSNLDAALRSAMRWEIRRIVKSAGTTAVYVTHDQAEALSIADRIALMCEGRIVQIGSGRELYEAPADRFVADFIGEANFLAATVAAVEGDEAVLDAPMGRLRGRARRPVAAGQEVCCCIRPESVQVRPGGEGGAGAAGENAFRGRLAQWHHLGESARFEVELDGGVRLAGAAMPARAPGEPAAALTVRIAPEDVVILPE